MIKQNRRVPGTINSTPINKTRQAFQNENQTLPIQSASCSSYLAGQSWGTETVSWKQRVLQDRYQSSEETQLVDLDLSDKGITDLEDSIDPDMKLPLVSVINLSSNHITSIPAGIFNKLSSLSKLYLSSNRIEKMSFPYFSENKLRVIDISSNCLKSLNLQHLDSLIKLSCSSNQLSFLTLPASLKFLNCASNKLTNIYFLEHCHELEEVDLSSNLLYDLKFNFKPYIKFKQDLDGANGQAYETLRRLDCSHNKIQFIEGMQLLPNLKIFLLSNNELCLTRHIINQLFLLQRLEALSFDGNPLAGSGLTQAEIVGTFLSRLPSLVTLNGQRTCELEQEGCESDRKSHFSSINEEPYQLFMDSHRKGEKQVFENAEWNFTLGDCENEQSQEHSKIHELSEIQIVNHTCEGIQPQIHQKQAEEEPCEKLVQKDFEQTYHLGLLNQREKEIRLKVTKSSSPLIPHHIFYQQFLAALLPMTYLPACPLRRGADLTSGRRLENQDDEYVLISRMFDGRGGVAYVKKVNRWNVLDGGREIFGKHGDPPQASAGFLLNEVSEMQFREHCKFNRLVRRGVQDIIGLQPNAFTYFHIIVRSTPSDPSEYYQCAYLVQTCQL